MDPEPILRHYLGKTDPYHLDDGRAEVLACECGETGCWPLVCRIEASVDEVRWSDFAQPHRAGRQSPPRHPGLWRYDGFGPFVFDRRQYEAALLAALPDAVRERIGREASSTLGEDGSMADAERLAAVVYVLLHEYEAAGGYDEVKFIGVYRSRERAEVAVERLRTQPGFVDHPEGFCIDAYELDLDHWTDGFFSSP